MFQQTFKNFSVSFDALNEGNTVSSGDPVAGHVSFDLTKSTNITSITMTLRGRAHVHWSTGGGGGGRRRRRRRRNFSAKVDFFSVGSAVLRENGASATKLQPGTHVYPFTCQLPEGDFPSTFRGVHGHTAYTLTMGINRQWRLSKDFVTELNYVNRIDTNQPELQAPLLGSNSMTVCSMWCAWFPIAMTVRTEKKAFVPGETVKMICEFSNASSGTATPKVKLQQKQVYYTHNKINKSECVKNLASVTGQPVSAHTSDVHTEIMVTIPLFAPLTISNCSILHVDYIIEVSLSVRASPNLVVLFPIILCDTPVNAHP